MKILLLTPLKIEYKAVRKHLLIDSIQPIHIEGSRYEQGKFQGYYQSYDIILKQTGSKNTDIALATERAIQHLHPEIIILTGIAGGVKDVKIGDIVVANKLYGYESGKETENGFVARPEVFYCSPDLIESAQNIDQKNDWQTRSSEAKNSKVYYGPIASGEKVIASTNAVVFERLKKHYNDTLALEMEAAGLGKVILYHPTIKFINIRGISDLLNNKTLTDKEGGQSIAVANVSAFVFELLYGLNPAQLNQPQAMTDLKGFVKELHQQLLPLLQSEVEGKKGLPQNRYLTSILEKVKPLLEEEYAEVILDFQEEDAHADFRNQLRRVLKKNEQLQKDLVALLEQSKEHNSMQKTKIESSKNVITNSHITVGGNFHLGDQN